MMRSMAALIMVLVFAGQALAGGIVCGLDALNSSLNHTDEMDCSTESQGDCEDMACCAQGKSPTGSVVAMVCCEVFCGESTGGAQFDFTPQTFSLAPTVVSYRTAEFDSFGSDIASSYSVFLRSADNHLLAHSPPDLFLVNSTFLI